MKKYFACCNFNNFLAGDEIPMEIIETISKYRLKTLLNGRYIRIVDEVEPVVVVKNKNIK